MSSKASVPLAPCIPKVVGGRYRLLNKIGSGSFGQVFKGTDTETNEDVAIKLEKMTDAQPQLIHERDFYQNVKLKDGVGIPRMRWYGQEQGYHVLVMDLLGPSLEDLFIENNRRFSLKSVLMLVDQMIELLEFIHTNNYIHRDIKPDNFLMGTGENSGKVYLIDFGLARSFRNLVSHAHIPYRDDKYLVGTARYASLNAHRNIQQSRRDDLESLGYVILYLYRGSLPWQGTRGATRHEKYEGIFKMKESKSLNELCKKAPEEFAVYLHYCRSLKFEDIPDYYFLRFLFRLLFRMEKFHYNSKFDWTKTK